MTCKEQNKILNDKIKANNIRVVIYLNTNI